MLRLAASGVIVLLAGTVLAGLLVALLPALGYAPVLGHDTISAEAIAGLLEAPGLTRSVLLSFLSGLLTAAVSLAIVVLFLASGRGSRLERLIRRAISPLLAVPHAAMAFGLAFLIAPSGMIVRALSPWLTGWSDPPDLLIVNDPYGLSMMAGLVLKEVPFLLLMSLAALPQVSAPDRLAVARTLGYRPVTAWLKAVLPALYPLIRLPVYAVIAYASSVVDVAMILGPTNPPPLGVAVLKWANDPDLDRLLIAAAAAWLQLGVTFAALATWRSGEGLAMRLGRAWVRRGTRQMGDAVLRRAGITLMGAIAVLSGLGLLSLGLWSIAGYWRFPDALPEHVTAATWQTALAVIGTPLANTLAVALVATGVSIAATIAALEHETRRGHPAGRLALTILYLPLIVPSVSFLLGIAVVMSFSGLRPGLAAVILGHVLFVLPYCYLSLSEAYRRLDPRLAALARTLGSRPAGVFWRVRLPLLATPILTAAAVGFAVSAGQYLPTQLLGAGRVPTITTEAVALAAGGDRRTIGVWAICQALLPAVAFMIAIGVPHLMWRHRRLMREAA
ncbi:MAG: ABC transporter permease subunit [Hyphomicrobiaceae bacterium]